MSDARVFPLSSQPQFRGCKWPSLAEGMSMVKPLGGIVGHLELSVIEMVFERLPRRW